ncbi:MAG: hypothetical protein J2P37_09850 [Ktedonobacteraceae bacterium]|nr:hypothetical protein [Ktedonobacteraceae bacterium]
MSTRALGFTLLAILVIGGLIVSFFMETIEQALTAPPVPRAGQTPITGAATKVVTPVQQPDHLLARDTFQRRDQRLWGTASDGRAWSGDASKNGNIFSINANTGQIANGPGAFNALLGQSNANSEVTLTGSVNRFAGGANLGAVLRWNDPNNWYKVLIDGTRLSILKRFHGTSVTLISTPFKAQTDTMYTLRFRVIGATLFARAWRSDVTEPANWMLTVSDMALPNGQNGVRVLLQKDTVINITAFTATTASSAM